MKSGSLLVSLALLVGCQTYTPATQEEASFDWLIGCWRSSEAKTQEVWLRSPSAGHLFGYSVTELTGESVFFEQIRIVVENAQATFYAYPAGVGPTAFAATSTGRDTVTFANAEHDYPQRITYTRQGKSLTATISLMDGSRPHSWHYQACDPQTSSDLLNL